jgi:hypothetical protein
MSSLKTIERTLRQRFWESREIPKKGGEEKETFDMNDP